MIELKSKNIFVKFGYENIDNNYYEYNDVSDIHIEGDWLVFTYLGKRLGTLQTVYFPFKYTHWAFKDVSKSNK